MKELLGYMSRHHEDLEKTLSDEQKEVFNAAIADWKAEMIEKFGKHACDAFGIK